MGDGTRVVSGFAGHRRDRPDWAGHSCSNIVYGGRDLAMFDWNTNGEGNYHIGVFRRGQDTVMWFAARTPDLDAWYGRVVALDHGAACPLIDWLIENAPPEFAAALDNALAAEVPRG